MIEAIKTGDNFAYEQAFVQYREKVYFFFLKKTKSTDHAKDLTQTTFLKLWQYRQSLSSEYLLDQHLFHIARTVYIDHVRKQNKISNAQKAIYQSQPDSVVYTSAAFDVEKRLQNVLSSMPELRRKVFILNRLHGYSYKEIASLLAISVKSVDNNLAKALRQLRKIFLLLVLVLFRVM